MPRLSAVGISGLPAGEDVKDGQRERLLDCLGTPLNAAQWEQDIIDAVEAFHGIGKGEGNAG